MPLGDEYRINPVDTGPLQEETQLTDPDRTDLHLWEDLLPESGPGTASDAASAVEKLYRRDVWSAARNTGRDDLKGARYVDYTDEREIVIGRQPQAEVWPMPSTENTEKVETFLRENLPVPVIGQIRRYDSTEDMEPHMVAGRDDILNAYTEAVASRYDELDYNRASLTAHGTCSDDEAQLALVLADVPHSRYTVLEYTGPNSSATERDDARDKLPPTGGSYSSITVNEMTVDPVVQMQVTWPLNQQEDG